MINFDKFDGWYLSCTYRYYVSSFVSCTFRRTIAYINGFWHVALRWPKFLLTPVSITWIWKHYTVALSDNQAFWDNNKEELKHKRGTGSKISKGDWQ